MKKLILVILFSPYFVQAQKIYNYLDIEAGGSSLLYSVGLNTNFQQKDSSLLGFRIGLGFYPINWGSNSSANSFVPSLQFNYNPAHFGNGKFTFRAGTTFYFNESYSNKFSDPVNGVFGYSYAPAMVYNSFNTGFMYNILKKDSKLSLNFGLDAIIAYRQVKENHIEIPIAPWPTIQYGVKF
jgi:hypothetical protein